MSFVMGTAGHVDHGKTSLIKALTGVDCDRLIEEKKRGITIELGFASLNLNNGQVLSIIDVPGHEKFVKNMVSGASGIDFVLLVIAADESIMPQTKEHLEICKLLGINKGIIALTKLDLVDDESLNLALEDINDYIKGSFLENAPIIPVSSYKNIGLDELKNAINSLVIGLQEQNTTDLFRLPIDRIFSLKGHGTILTGTIYGSSVKVQDELQIYPSTKTARVRSIQSHNNSVIEGYYGSRAAINLAGTEVNDFNRGDTLAKPDTLFPSKTWLVNLECLKSAPKEIKNRCEVHIHHASKENLARIYLYKKDKLQAGESCLAQIRFTEEMLGVFGDNCIIRSFSPLRTIAGAKILQALPNAPELNKFCLEDSQKLLALSLETNLENIIFTHLELMQDKGLSETEILVLTNTTKAKIAKALAKLTNKIALYDIEEKSYITKVCLQSLMQKVLKNADKFHKQDVYKAGMAKNVLLSPFKNIKLANYVLETLIKSGEIVKDGDILRLKTHQINLDSFSIKFQEKIMEIYVKAGLEVPNLSDLEVSLKINDKELQKNMKILLQNNKLVKISEKLYCSKQVILDLQNKLASYFKNKKTIDQAEFKILSGNLSRKYTIAYLEYFDREKVTVRVGDVRQARSIIKEDK